jgi:hypothetical protein
MAKHNPKLNPCAPYRKVKAFTIGGVADANFETKEAVFYLALQKFHSRAIRKMLGLSGRQFRKAIYNIKRTANV